MTASPTPTDDDQHAGREQAEQDEARQERAGDGADCPDGREPADDRAAGGEIGQRAADEHRRRRREDGSRHDERGRGEEDDRDQPLPQPDAADHPDDRHRGDGAESAEDERRTEERERADGVGGRPPIQAPRAMPARIAPMIPV